MKSLPPLSPTNQRLDDGFDDSLPIEECVVVIAVGMAKYSN
jgi:hypothetical protein